MSKINRIGTVFAGFFVSSALVLAVVLTAVYASNLPQDDEFDFASIGESNSLQFSSALSVTIMSSPWAALDSNKPDLEGPSVFIVEARVINLGPDPATNVEVTVDYNDEDAGWTLLEGEDPSRRVNSLEVGSEEAFYAYWFAQYPRTIGESHQYTVTAKADGVAPVSTSTNYFDDNLLPQGTTAQTKSYVSAGNSGITSVFSDVVVGAVFTVDIEYDLGNSPEGVQFSPVGNSDFDPESSQLLSTVARFHNGFGVEEVIVDDQLYFSIIPQVDGQTAEKVEISYIFLPQRLGTIRMCSYAGVEYQIDKYDNDYCDEPAGTVVIIDFDQSITLTKEASSPSLLQSETLTYTIHYTNQGPANIALAWIWDQFDDGLVSVLTDTIDPPNDPTESGSGLIAWDIGAVPAPPDPSSSGAVTFTVVVDGQGVDLADGTELVNQAFMGFSGFGLPSAPALTSTITTTIQAPQVELTKSDGLDTVEPGALVTYTLVAKNSGSAAANSLVLTDVLPSGVIYQEGATGNPSFNGQTLVWDDLGSLTSNGGSITITVPVTVNWLVADGTVLTNTVYARFTNEAGYQYQEQSATDTTTVQAPDLFINKSAFPDPVLSGATLTYTLVYTNSGLGTATNVVITDVTPLSTTYQSCTGGDTCYLDNDTVTWELASIPAQSNGSVSFVVGVDSGLEDGTILVNGSYGLSSDQRGINGKPVNTTVLRSAGFVDGHTYEDTNGNGSLDPGETGISNVDLSLPAAKDPDQTSDAGGYYQFRVEDEKWVSVSAGLPDNYFRTSPETVWLENSFGVTSTVDFGYAPVDSPFGVIYGTVFEDLDGDGAQEPGEAGLEGVLLKVNGTLTTTTNALGQYAFTLTVDGNYKIVETDPDGYISTTPNEVVVSVAKGNSQEVNFGDVPAFGSFATILGSVFDDLNGDGVWDDDEPGLKDVLVTLDGSVSTLTDIYGRYSFTTTIPGVHGVVETDPGGYRSTTPNRVNVLVTIGQGYTVNFGDTQYSGTANLFGIVFDDLDGDGSRDTNEAGIEGVLVTLNGNLDVFTDQFGRYAFAVSNSGVHKVVESDPAGYFSTTPNEVHLGLNLGETAQVDFGDAKSSSGFASVFGTVFEDLNSDGNWDDDEVGISSVTINFDNSATQTGKYGGYSFKMANPGDFEVVEVDPVGYFSTTPNEVEVSVTLGNGYQVDFGDVPVEIAQCSGDEYEPDNILEEANNLSIGEVQKHDFCDNAVDWVMFEATRGFIYTMMTSSWGQRADTVVTLYDASGKRLGGNDDVEGSDDFSSKFMWEAQTGGVHYLRVTNRAGLTGFHTDYDLTLLVEENYYLYLPISSKEPGLAINKTQNPKPAVRPESPLEPAGVITHSCPDDYEIDDTWQLANPVEPGVEQVRSFDSNPFVYAADKDFLWFDLSNFGVFTFTIESVINTTTLMELYDSDGDTLGVSDGAQIIWSEAPPGRYYLSVSPGPGNTNYGCTDEAGYTLLVMSKPGYSLFLPVVSSSD